MPLALGLAIVSCPLVAQSVAEESEVYPQAFRGDWAPSLAECQNPNSEAILTIGASKIWFYEADSKLLKITPVVSFTAPSGAEARTVHALVAERGELELGVAPAASW